MALLVAVFPVNVHMALAPGAAPALLWLRLPLQAGRLPPRLHV